ncbi:adenylosuccinate synthase [Chryseobacterium sp. 22458]|uniref:adenylosuccinate synthase n=1 Tax=Chryseobacterium sp. 22458 TaxID=3453921 RepID=UPI003F861607
MDIVLGLQWGDEGKGKFIDLISENYDITARFNGGSNAGHSIERNGRKITLKMIPSGIFMKEVQNIIGTGTVLDPVSFKKEILNLQAFDHTVQPEKNIIISKKAHVVMPTHKLLDVFMEENPEYTTIGTTKNGIAQAYSNKILRQNLRVGDIGSPDFESRASHILKRDYKMLEDGGMIVLPALEEITKEFFDAVEFLKKFTCAETEIYLNKALAEGKKILAEGSQATMLDIDHGTYPYVTSSSTTASGASSGLGVSPKKIGEIYGIAKAYCTRVGNGAFPTELLDEFGDDLRMKGNEFGSNTGRPRRIGWLDLPALKYAVMINGVTQLVLTKADVLSGLKSVAVCTHYELNGESIPVSGTLPENAQPVLKWMEGWNADFSNMKSAAELPQEIISFLSFLEAELEIPVGYLSTGPGREQMIKMK